MKTVVVDLYGPYQKLFQSLFPKADLIIDCFHIVTQVNRALNIERVAFMKTVQKSSDSKSKKDYRKLKKYWKLILEKEEELKATEYRYHRLFKGMVTERGIVDYFFFWTKVYATIITFTKQLSLPLTIGNQNCSSPTSMKSNGGFHPRWTKP